MPENTPDQNEATAAPSDANAEADATASSAAPASAAPAEEAVSASAEQAAPEATPEPAPSPTPEAVAASEPESKPVEIPEALRDCISKIHETIQNDLDDRELVKILKKHVRKLKEWDSWSEHARNAYAHLIAAEIVHSKAASIYIDNGIEFEKDARSEYEHLLRAVQKRTPRSI